MTRKGNRLGETSARRHLRGVLIKPLIEFTRLQASGGLALLACAVFALAWANSPFAHVYFLIWETKVDFAVGDFRLALDLRHFINDGLMALFFLLVGLEIKREILLGELSTWRKAALPLFAAVGGMLAPGLIYYSLNYGSSTSLGWGIPVATDIAFALGVLALLGERVPFAAKAFLAAFAIADDIGAVLVIAVAYTSDINGGALGVAAGFFVVMMVSNLVGLRNIAAFLLLALGLWAAMAASGVHASIAGVLVAIALPTWVNIDSDGFVKRARAALNDFEASCDQKTQRITEDQQFLIQELELACEKAQMPIQRLENMLHPWITFIVVPLFALANAGVPLSDFSATAAGARLTLGVASGLMIGKPVGIVLFSWLAVRSGIASLPDGIQWLHLAGVACLGGIGFTMSLFIAEMSFGGSALLPTAKAAVFGASLTAGALGATLLLRSGKASTARS